MPTMRKVLKRIALGAGILLALLGVLGAGAGLWLHARVTASLPVLDGKRALAGLNAAVEIERDGWGVPTLRGGSRTDLARATGWLHAQDRFFQMDLLRRHASGELAELLGPAVLRMDRRNRVHGFRRRAERMLRATGGRPGEMLRAYTEGVNAGLAALVAVPPEYLLLRTEPAPWVPEDSVLVLLGMFLLLGGDNGAHESAWGRLREELPAELFAFLTPSGTEWDAPLLGGPAHSPPVPPPAVVDLRAAGDRDGTGRAPRSARGESGQLSLAGSNNWAVDGSHSADGGALIASDMHLPLGMPNIWYRTSLVWDDASVAGGARRVTGVTLPGVPTMVSGSNGDVAWGFTNSAGDWIDLVVLEIDPDNGGRYRTPDGYREFERHDENIRVRGGETESLEVRSTIWGPVIDRDHLGRERALRWVAHDVEGVNFRLVDLESVRTVDEAVEVARRCGIPAQNLVAADRQGRVAWTLAGMLPRRFGHDGSVPVSWASGDHGWDGWLDPEEYPLVVDPESGRLWTANNRVVGESMLDRVGRPGCDLGARARQIRDALLALQAATAEDMLAIQLDDRALLLARWRELLLSLLTPEVVAEDPRREELRRLVAETWTGRASVESTGFRLVRGYRSFLADQVFTAILAPWFGDDPPFDYTNVVLQWEGPLWRLVTERPQHLLDPRFADWEDQLIAATDALLDYYAENFEGDLAERTWGERNTVRIEHPLSSALPQLSKWLDIEPQPLPGDGSNLPRVQSPRFGASQRFAVSPGREEGGYFHMPGGQSGHPLSPYYRAGHEAWVNGEPTPFLPGPAVHRLTLEP